MDNNNQQKTVLSVCEPLWQQQWNILSSKHCLWSLCSSCSSSSSVSPALNTISTRQCSLRLITWSLMILSSLSSLSVLSTPALTHLTREAGWRKTGWRSSAPETTSAPVSSASNSHCMVLMRAYSMWPEVETQIKWSQWLINTGAPVTLMLDTAILLLWIRGLVLKQRNKTQAFTRLGANLLEDSIRISLNNQLGYRVYIYDPFFFEFSANPQLFPGKQHISSWLLSSIASGITLHHNKPQPGTMLKITFKTLYHKKMNRVQSPCNQDNNYSFITCVRYIPVEQWRQVYTCILAFKEHPASSQTMIV